MRYQEPDKSFIIVVFHKRQKIRLTCRQISLGIQADVWEVQARNKCLIFENNRPALIKAGLPHFAWTWKLTRGELRDETLKSDIIMAIESHIAGKGKPPLYPV